MATKLGNLNIVVKKFGSLDIAKEVLNGTVIYEKGGSVDPILENNSWATIRAVCEAGNAANFWAVGDTKTDLGTDGNTRTFRIADMQGLYNKHVVFEQVELENHFLDNTSSSPDSSGYYNNYSLSPIRLTHLPALILKYSSDLQGSLTDTMYKVGADGENGTVLDLTDKLFLPAEKELTATKVSSLTIEFNALTTFQYYVTNSANSYRIKIPIGSNTASWWFERSPHASQNYICAVNASGATTALASSAGYAPVFSF